MLYSVWFRLRVLSIFGFKGRCSLLFCFDFGFLLAFGLVRSATIGFISTVFIWLAQFASEQRFGLGFTRALWH